MKRQNTTLLTVLVVGAIILTAALLFALTRAG